MKNIVGTIILALAGLFCFSAPAAAQPCQWNYSAPGNVSTATYCGNVIVNGTIIGAPTNAFSSMAALAAQTAAEMSAVGYEALTGYYAGSTAGGGNFTWLSAAQASGYTPDGGVIIAPSDNPGSCSAGCLMRQLVDGAVTPQMFGAYGNGSNDDTTAFQKAINSALLLNISNTIQNAAAAYVFCPPGSYKVTSSLTFTGSGTPLPNVAIRISGASRAACTLAGNVAGPIIKLYTQSASATVDHIYISNSNADASNSCIQIEGNGQIIDHLWGVCLTVIDIESINGEPATDIQLSNIQADLSGYLLHIGSLASDGTVAPQRISVVNASVYGGGEPLTSASTGILCDAAAGNITISNFSTTTMSGYGIIMRNNCSMNLSNYALQGTNYGTAVTTQTALRIESGTLNLGVGEIHDWNGEAILAATGSTIIDTGANIYNVNKNTGADCDAPVCVQGGSYTKTGENITGGNNETYLVAMTSGNLKLSNVRLTNSKGGAVTAAGNYVGMSGVLADGLNTSLSNTSIALGAVGTAQINGNTISNNNAPTNVLTYTSGTVNVTYNNAHLGAWPTSAGTLFSVGNQNY